MPVCQAVHALAYGLQGIKLPAGKLKALVVQPGRAGWRKKQKRHTPTKKVSCHILGGGVAKPIATSSINTHTHTPHD